MSETPGAHLKPQPIILKKNKTQLISNDYLLKYMQKRPTFRRDVLYVADKNDALYNEFPNLTIINVLNILSNTNRTVATFSVEAVKVELNSDRVTEFLGQKNYDIVLNAISSVFNQTLKVQAILALLTREHSTKQSVDRPKDVSCVDKHCQTYESFTEKLKRQRGRKRARQCKVYVIDENNTPSEDKPEPVKRKPQKKPKDAGPTEQTVQNSFLINEDSNMSDISLSNISLSSSLIANSVLENPLAILNFIDRYTEDHGDTQLKLVNGSVVTLKSKPEDLFHIATPANLIGLSAEDQKKVLLHQAYIDWKYCLEQDSDGNLPIHSAVLDNDVELLRRQCLVLKSRQEDMDTLGGAGMSALQLSISRNLCRCVSTLLSLGAQVSQTDSECRNILHFAAESSAECVRVVLDHCRSYARNIILDEVDLWKVDFEEQSNEELSAFVINKLCSAFDNQGYTPLMLASGKGSHAVVAELARADPSVVNLKMPNCGNTALYIAMSAAVCDAERSGNCSKISADYLNTMRILCKHGADPNVANDSGNSVTNIIGEFKCIDVAQILANKILANDKKAFDSFMLVKDSIGGIKVEPMALAKPIRIDANSNKRVSVKPKSTQHANDDNEHLTNDADSFDYAPNEHEIKTRKVDSPKVVILQNIPLKADKIDTTSNSNKGDTIAIDNIANKKCDAPSKGIDGEETSKQTETNINKKVISIKIGAKLNDAHNRKTYCNTKVVPVSSVDKDPTGADRLDNKSGNLLSISTKMVAGGQKSILKLKRDSIKSLNNFVISNVGDRIILSGLDKRVFTLDTNKANGPNGGEAGTSKHQLNLCKILTRVDLTDTRNKSTTVINDENCTDKETSNARIQVMDGTVKLDKQLSKRKLIVNVGSNGVSNDKRIIGDTSTLYPKKYRK